eukprot:4383515-Amphidinium_carterae.2
MGEAANPNGQGRSIRWLRGRDPLLRLYGMSVCKRENVQLCALTSGFSFACEIVAAAAVVQ